MTSFGHKVESITVYESTNKTPPDRKKYSLIWHDILLLCPNLISVYFHFIHIFYYLRVFYDGRVQLNNFQFFDIFNLSLCNLATRQVYHQINLKYRATIIDLSIVRLDDIPDYKEYNDFIKFIRQFPKLINLYLLGKSYRPPISNIDIHQLLEAAPRLKRFETRGFKKVSIDSFIVEYNHNDDDAIANLSNNSDMFRLCIEVIEMDVKTFKYITARLKNADYVSFQIERLMPEETFSQIGTIPLFKYLESCLSEIKSFYIKYNYKGYNYFLNSYTGRRIEAADGYESHEYEANDVTEITGFNVRPNFLNDDEIMSPPPVDYSGLSVEEDDEESNTSYEIQSFGPMNVDFE